jgi:hypothetical protein
MGMLQDQLLRLTSAEGKQIVVGYLEQQNDDKLCIGCRGTAEQGDFRPHGRLTLDTTQLELVIRRQRLSIPVQTEPERT